MSNFELRISDWPLKFEIRNIRNSKFEWGLVEARARLCNRNAARQLSVQRLGWLAAAGDAPAKQPTL